jgi:DNA-binding MarR family transcriptional regulator
MPKDSVDLMIEAWARSHPELDVGLLEAAGRLLLSAQYLQHRLVEALRPLGLSFGDFDVLNTLRRVADPDGTNPRDLAHSALVTTGAMTARLHRLDSAGLIRRVPDQADGRAVRILLTRRGRRLAERALSAVMAGDEEFFAPLTDRQHSALVDALRSLLVRAEAEV